MISLCNFAGCLFHRLSFFFYFKWFSLKRLEMWHQIDKAVNPQLITEIYRSIQWWFIFAPFKILPSFQMWFISQISEPRWFSLAFQFPFPVQKIKSISSLAEHICIFVRGVMGICVLANMRVIVGVSIPPNLGKCMCLYVFKWMCWKTGVRTLAAACATGMCS